MPGVLIKEGRWGAHVHTGGMPRDQKGPGKQVSDALSQEPADHREPGESAEQQTAEGAGPAEPMVLDVRPPHISEA